MGREASPREPAATDARAKWRFTRPGECQAVGDPSALRTTGSAPSGTADHRFLSDLPGNLMNCLDVTAGTHGEDGEGRE